MLTFLYILLSHSRHCVSICILGGISVGVVGEWCVEGGWGGVVWVVHVFRCAYVYEYQ